MLSTVYGLWGCCGRFGRCCGRFGRPWGTFWKGLAPLVRGASRLGCVFTKGTSPSRRVPSYNLLQVGAHTLQILCMVSAQEDMFMCMRTTARGAARHAVAQVDGCFRKVKRSRQAAAPPPRRNRPVVAHVVPLEHKRAGRGAGGPGPLTQFMSHFLLVLCLGLQYDA